jgi:hypothetical protein
MNLDLDDSDHLLMLESLTQYFLVLGMDGQKEKSRKMGRIIEKIVCEYINSGKIQIVHQVFELEKVDFQSF